MKFGIWRSGLKVLGKFNFGSYLSNMTPSVHEAQIVLHWFSQNGLL